MLLNDEELLRIERAYCAQSLAQFAERAWHVLEPATPLKWGWALDAICEHLEAVTSGEIKRLLVNVPPGCMKSLLTGVIWPAWEWGPRNMQAMRYLGTAHKQDLAVRDSTKCRRLIRSEWFQRLWAVQLTGDQDAKTKFENIKTGFRESMSFTSLTGSRADRVLCFPYDQCIMTEKGMLKIGDIVENKINVRILGANKDSLSWQKITRYDKNQKNQIVKIATKRGSIECTADHPIYVSGRGFVEARRLRKGDRIKSLISQDMRELREIISTSTKAVDWKGSGNMLCRLPMGAKSSTSTIKRNIGLPGVWVNGLSQPITQSQKQIGFLWPEVCGKSHDRGNESVVFRRESCKGMRGLQQDVFCEQNRIISASYMQQNMWELACMGQIWKTAARNSMRKLCKYFQANIKIFKVLFNGVQKCRPFKTNVIKWKPEICTRTSKFSISSWVEKWIKTKNKRSRWELLQSMWNVWRNSIGSSYRLHQRKPRCDEFDISVREMSRINASEGFEKTRGIEDVVVESVGFLEKEEVTYNLCVEHDHVYFPGGFLAHNCDDPLSADDANSEAALRAAEITFTESLPTRVNNDQSAIVVIMQRLNEKDTSGIILSRDLGYTHLCLPMRYEADRKCTTSIGFTDPRTKDGELLFPERFGESQVKELESILGSYAAAGQLQQRPAPREGGMFKRSWFNVVRAVPANTQFVRGWDLASTNGAGDWTVGVKLGRMPSGRFMIAGVARDQLSSAGVERLIVNTASQDGLECRISLPQDPGQAGKAQASYLVQKLAGYNVSTSTESGDKVTRASPMAAQAEAGNIDILEGEWNDTFLNELSIFPAGAKDQTDAASRAFNELVMGSKFDLEAMI